MKTKKLLAGILAASILSLSTVTAFAANTDKPIPILDANQVQEATPIKAELPTLEKFKFNSFTGTVKAITDFEGVEGSKFVLVESSDGEEANIILSKHTYVLNNAAIAVGSVVTGYYDANAPMIMIYPAQYNAEVIVVDNKDYNVKVDLFDENLLSSDQFLKLNISDETEIILQDGTAFKGVLANRKLIVLYGASTKSIPAQTTPDKIIVLSQIEAPPIVDLPVDVSSMDIIVNNNKIEAPAAYSDNNGNVMVPLRAISEALGFEVTWDNNIKSAFLDKNISLRIGLDSYHYMKTAPIQLGAAPAIVEGRTYVPLSFFRTVARMNNAYIFEAQIVVDNGEKME
jgi:hypothetical protein